MLSVSLTGGFVLAVVLVGALALATGFVMVLRGNNLCVFGIAGTEMPAAKEEKHADLVSRTRSAKRAE